MPHLLELDAWMTALEWTPDTAGARVTDLCTHLRDESPAVWLHRAPHIGAGLTCLAGDPDELHRLADEVYDVSPNGGPKLRAMILAHVDAALPEHLAWEAIRNGSLLAILANKNYAIGQRLTWLKEHSVYVFAQGSLAPYEDSLETPIKDALMLWFHMAAIRGGFATFNWDAVDLIESEVAKKQFLEMNAPGLVAQIDIVMALGLSYPEAVDMVIDPGAGEMPAPLLELPEMGADHPQLTL